jgi:hypothetical protein
MNTAFCVQGTLFLVRNAAILAGSSVLQKVGWPLWYRSVSVGLAALGLHSFVMFVVELNTAAVHVLPPAVWERCSVYSIIAWQVFAAARLILGYTGDQ